MKKICIFLIGLQIVLSCVLLVKISSNMVTIDLLYKNTSKISIMSKNTSTETNDSVSKKIQSLEKLSLKYNVPFYKYIFKSSNDLNIYTTDFSKDSQIILLDGRFPKSGTNEQISNIRNNNSETVGRFLWTNSNDHIAIKDFSQIVTTGIDGVYYIGTTNDTQIKHIISDMEKIFDEVMLQDIIKVPNKFIVALPTLIIKNPLLLISLLVLILINLFIFIYYIIENNKKMAIYQIHGYSVCRKLIELIKPLLYTLVIFTIISYFIIYLYHNIIYGGFYANSFIKNSLITINTIIFLLFFITSLLILKFRKNKINLPLAIKGRNSFTSLLFLNSITKIIFIFMILISISYTWNYKNKLASELSNYSNWEKAQDVYRVQLRFITSDPNKYRPYDIKLKEFYKLLQKKGLFLVDCTNYNKIFSEKFSYEENTTTIQEQLTTPRGKSITINNNYLKYNPIKKENGELITQKDIIVDDNILNILIPISLRQYEEEITNNYLEDFEFKKNFWDLNRNKEIEKQKLKLNIIYIEENQNYFTFNPNILNETNNLVLNPIVILDTTNLDPSFYSSYLSKCSFFNSNGEDGYQYILPTIIESNTLSNIQSVSSVYNERADIINDLKERIFYLENLNLILSLILIFNSISFFSAYFEKNKYLIAVKRVFGYGFLRMILFICFITLFIDLSVALITISILKNYTLLYPTLLILFIEILILLAYCLFINKNIPDILNKEELN